MTVQNLDQLNEMLGIKPELRLPPKDASIEELISNMEHNIKVKESK